MRTVAAVYKKFGRYLTEPLAQVQPQTQDQSKKRDKAPMSFVQTDFKAHINSFKVNQELNLIPGLFQLTKSIARLDNLSCIKCGSDFKVEMHHVRAMKDLDPKISGVDRLMIRANRKQIPLCRPCHLKYHFEHKTPNKRRNS
jgi:hypothetical protein